MQPCHTKCGKKVEDDKKIKKLPRIHAVNYVRNSPNIGEMVIESKEPRLNLSPIDVESVDNYMRRKL